MHWLNDLLYFVGVTVVFRYMFLPWLTGIVVKLFERLFAALERRIVKTEREALEWIHYRDRAAKQGHRPKKVLDCQDGDCMKVTR